MSGMRVHTSHRRTATKPGTDKHAVSLGARVGYWPCLRAPFFSVYWGSHVWEIWYGLPSYLDAS